MIAKFLCSFMLLVGMSTAGAVTSSPAMTELPLLEEGDSVKCFSPKECVHAALVKSKNFKNISKAQGLATSFRRPEIVSLGGSRYLAAIDYGLPSKRLYLVDLEINSFAYSMQIEVTSGSKFIAVSLD